MTEQEIKTEKRTKSSKGETVKTDVVTAANPPEVEPKVEPEINQDAVTKANPPEVEQNTTVAKSAVLRVKNLSHFSFFEPCSGVFIAEYATVDIDLQGENEQQIVSNLEQISFLNGDVLELEVLYDSK